MKIYFPFGKLCLKFTFPNTEICWQTDRHTHRRDWFYTLDCWCRREYLKLHLRKEISLWLFILPWCISRLEMDCWKNNDKHCHIPHCGCAIGHFHKSCLKLRWSSTNLTDIFSLLTDRQERLLNFVTYCATVMGDKTMLIILISPNPYHSLSRLQFTPYLLMGLL